VVDSCVRPWRRKIAAGLLAVSVVSGCVTVSNPSVVAPVQVPSDPESRATTDLRSSSGDARSLTPEDARLNGATTAPAQIVADSPNPPETRLEGAVGKAIGDSPTGQDVVVVEPDLSCPHLPMVSPPYWPYLDSEEEMNSRLAQWWEKTMGSIYSDFAKLLVGLPADFAADCVIEVGAVWRVVEQDGEPVMGTKDYRIDRVNVVIGEGVVLEAHNG